MRSQFFLDRLTRDTVRWWPHRTPARDRRWPARGLPGSRGRTSVRPAWVSGDRELSMPNPNTRRAIRRAARLAIASGGICLLLSFPAQQARAATGGQPPLLSGLTGVLGSVV